MKRAKIVKHNEPFEFEELDIPVPPADGLVVKSVYSGMCHSDMNHWKDRIDLGGEVFRVSTNPNYKGVPGHEVAGHVYSMGENVAKEGNLKVGDRVVVYPWMGCKTCGYCLKGCPNMCDVRSNIGYDHYGGYSSFVLLPKSKYALKVPESVPMEIACLLACSGITAYNAMTAAKQEIESATEFEGKASLMIVGAGGLGLWGLQICRATFPKTTKIVMADVSEGQLSVAKNLGCDDTVLWSRDEKESVIVEATKSKSLRKDGFNAIIDFVNTTVTFERGFNCLSKNGVMALVGLFGGGAKLSLPKTVFGSKQIRGVYTGRQQHLEELLKMMSEHQLVSPPIKYFRLEEVNDAFKLMDQGKMKGRGVIKFD